MSSKPLVESDSDVIKRLGGPVAIGKIFGITPQAVCQWRRKGIPRPNRMYLMLRYPEAFCPVSKQRTPPPNGHAAPPPAEQLVDDAAAGQPRQVTHSQLESC